MGKFVLDIYIYIDTSWQPRTLLRCGKACQMCQGSSQLTGCFPLPLWACEILWLYSQATLLSANDPWFHHSGGKVSTRKVGRGREGGSQKLWSHTGAIATCLMHSYFISTATCIYRHQLAATHSCTLWQGLSNLPGFQLCPFGHVKFSGYIARQLFFQLMTPGTSTQSERQPKRK